MALPAVPDWLKTRDGSLKQGIRDNIILVMLAAEPQYRLEQRPAKGTFECCVIQSNNGRRLDDGATYPSPDAAFSGGLEQLRTRLGW